MSTSLQERKGLWLQLLKAGNPEHAHASLQSTLKMNLAQAILDGHISEGTRLPSTRALAGLLGIARITVALTYEALTAQGFLVVRERSGHFVAEGLRDKHKLANIAPRPLAKPPSWTAHIAPLPRDDKWLEKPRQWQKYRYPFVYGQMDSKLFPLAEWRECSRLALATPDSSTWAADSIDRDDGFLIEQLCKRVLPRRGIEAAPEQVLITVGSQMGAYLLSELLVRRGTNVALEDPGYMDGRNIFLRRGAKIIPMQVDHDGAVPPTELEKLSCVYCTPSHQCPAGAWRKRVPTHHQGCRESLSAP